MANIFPRWINWLPLRGAVVLGAVALGVVLAATYYLPPSYSAVGYQPEQPIPFSHKIHVEQNGMDCRYCHSFVDRAAHSNIPSAETCWGCHEYVKTDSPQLVNLRRAVDENYEHYDGKPLVWTQIHRTPDYVKFDHRTHILRGVSCVECHGRVDQMDVVYQHETLSMGFCLECHRNPEKALRPLEQTTNLAWQADGDAELAAQVAKASQDRFEALSGQIKQIREALGKEGVSADEKEQLEFELAQLSENREFYEELVQAWERQSEINDSKIDAEGLAQEYIGAFLKESWNINPPLQCGGCHR